ncbi:DUF4396 domain-containing protein [Kitasatospora sp. NA04385]|uniref:DUF4396 domain-containing protein n=1 Tax=Kitasatospora sp. NA04385 TaxID=2742135 RepID=UPI001590E9B2|nr:DUF4396 domain-containing protein [Kitasatospora sp. NA04385]QKW20471.1 DUF4396 domain-containing protein [Kitasatospora sp. NA04385]
MEHSTHPEHEHHHAQHEHAHENTHAHANEHAHRTGHQQHAGHAHHARAHGGGSSWRTAAQATLHCLTGCAIGEVLGQVIGVGLGLHNGATVVLSIALAFVFGYALTMRGVLKAGLPLRDALKVALAADTVSIIVMELIDNGVMVAVPGAMDAGLGQLLFWVSLAGSLVLAFLVTVPVNRWLIGRGRGHAVVHAYH